MLTDEARRQRMWAALPALGQLFADKHVPDRYFGPSSVSDNMFDQVHRLMIVTILIRENIEAIKHKLASDRDLAKDIYTVTDWLKAVARQFDQDRKCILDEVLSQRS